MSRIYEIAERELGVAETPGAASSPRVDEYLSTVGLSGDETPWCAAFVNWVLEEAGCKGTGAANARSYEKWGVPVDEADVKRGDVVVLRRGSEKWQGHVLFFDKFVMVDGVRRVRGIGGNQSNRVTEASYPVSEVVAYRRPKTPVDSTTVAAGVGAVATKAAEQATDFVTTISVEAEKVQSILPLISNDTFKLILGTISAALVVYVIFERIRRLGATGV